MANNTPTKRVVVTDQRWRSTLSSVYHLDEREASVSVVSLLPSITFAARSLYLQTFLTLPICISLNSDDDYDDMSNMLSEFKTIINSTGQARSRTKDDDDSFDEDEFSREAGEDPYLSCPRFFLYNGETRLTYGRLSNWLRRQAYRGAPTSYGDGALSARDVPWMYRSDHVLYGNLVLLSDAIRIASSVSIFDPSTDEWFQVRNPYPNMVLGEDRFSGYQTYCDSIIYLCNYVRSRYGILHNTYLEGISPARYMMAAYIEKGASVCTRGPGFIENLAAPWPTIVRHDAVTLDSVTSDVSKLQNANHCRFAFGDLHASLSLDSLTNKWKVHSSSLRSRESQAGVFFWVPDMLANASFVAEIELWKFLGWSDVLSSLRDKEASVSRRMRNSLMRTRRLTLSDLRSKDAWLSQRSVSRTIQKRIFFQLPSLPAINKRFCEFELPNRPGRLETRGSEVMCEIVKRYLVTVPYLPNTVDFVNWKLASPFDLFMLIALVEDRELMSLKSSSEAAGAPFVF